MTTFAFFSDPQIEQAMIKERKVQFQHLVNALKGVHNKPPFNTPLDCIFIGGDLTELTRKDEWDAFKEVFDPASLNAPCKVLLGNHDNLVSHSDPVFLDILKYANSADPWKPYAIKLKDVHILCLRNYESDKKGWDMSSSIAWLKDYLSKIAKNEPVVIIMHYGFDELSLGTLAGWGGVWWPYNVRVDFLNALKGYGVDLLLSGHLHTTDVVSMASAPRYAPRANVLNFSGGATRDSDQNGSSFWLFRFTDAKIEVRRITWQWNENGSWQYGLKIDPQNFDLNRKPGSVPLNVAPRYFHFSNTLNQETIVKVHVINGGQFYWCAVGPNGGTGVPYEPGHPDWRFNVTFYTKGREDILGGAANLTVHEGSLLCELVSIGNGNHTVNVKLYTEPV